MAMARLAAVLFSIIFSLFLLASARFATPEALNGDSGTVHSQPALANVEFLSVDAPEKDQTSIRLPSEKHEESASSSAGDAAFVEASLIPRDAHGMRKMGGSWFRFPHRCRGHSRHGPRQISYGRDMVGIPELHHMRTEAKLFPFQIREGERQFPGEIRGFPVRLERFGDRHLRKGDALSEEFISFDKDHVHHMPAGWMRHGGHMRHMPERPRRSWNEAERKEDEEGGLMKRFQEVLNRFLRA